MEFLHDKDYLQWFDEQVIGLEAKAIDRIDINNRINLLQRLGKEEVDYLHTAVELTMVSLIILTYIPYGVRHKQEKACVTHFRGEIGRLLTRSPSLRNELEVLFSQLWPVALSSAASSLKNAGIRAIIPDAQLFNIDNVCDHKFWPEMV